MTLDDIKRVIEKEPSLTSFGFGVFGDYHPEKSASGEFEKSRATLLAASKRCTQICDWLSDIEQTPAHVKELGSYDLKHAIEQTLPSPYCSNEECICAAIHMGFAYEKDGPNAYFNMLEASVRAKREEEAEKHGKGMTGIPGILMVGEPQMRK